MTRLSPSESRQFMANPVRAAKKSKYRNERVEVDGITFDSKKEAKRFGELKMMERAGLIRNLCVHFRYEIPVNGVVVCEYEADFVYIDKAKGFVVEDAKGVRTAVYRLKKKLMKAVHGIDIVEV